jgi:acyl-CoA synthetase (AMP-forming)/AMP-acid ligase II
MAHPFDDAVDAIRAAITAADGAMPVRETIVRGVAMPAFSSAPPDLPRFFEYFCALHADKPCLVDGNERLSFADVYALAQCVARGLIERHDVKPGDHIALAGRNSAAWVVAYMAIILAGGVATLINGFWTGAAMRAAIADTACRLVLADARCEAALAAEEGLSAAILPLDLDRPVHEARIALMGDGDDVALPQPGPDAPATILFTSGTTGTCKGALSDQRAKVQAAMHFASSAAAIAALFARQGALPAHSSATLLCLPLFHVTAEVSIMLHSFVIGRKMVVMPRWDPIEAMRLIEAEQVTALTGVPLMGIELATHPRRHEFDLSTLTDVAAGGAPRPADHVERICAGLGCHPGFGYGLTETNAVGAGIIRAACRDRPETPGKATPPLSDIAIFDVSGAVLGPGDVGEIGIRSAASISGYWNRPDETAALFAPSGHVMTGDMGSLDAEGYLTIVDRKKDIIIRGGENIASIAVESALYAEPDVLECAVFGIPDERLGEVPVAVVRLAAGSGHDEDTLHAALAARLARFERPVAIGVGTDPLPRLGSEKIDKRALRDAWLTASRAG